MKVTKLIFSCIILSAFLISCASTNSNQENSNTQAPTISSEIEEKSNSEQDSESDKFIKSLEGINISFTKSPKATQINKNFNSSFDFTVKDKSGNTLANYPLTISYPSSKEKGEILYNEIDIKTDANGTYSYTA